MRRKIERLASSLPGFLNLMLTAAINHPAARERNGQLAPLAFCGLAQVAGCRAGCGGNGSVLPVHAGSDVAFIITVWGRAGLVLSAVLLTAIKRILKLAGR